MNRALRLVIALACAAPASAGVAPSPNGPGNETLERVSDLAAGAQTSASLETAGHTLSRGYDLASAQTPAQSQGVDGKPLPNQLTAPAPESGVHYTGIPRPDVQADKVDSEAAKAAEKADQAKLDLKRMMIGGAAAGLVFAVFGFIFGGPIGALALGAIGFGAYAGITYLNNNPIK